MMGITKKDPDKGDKVPVYSRNDDCYRNLCYWWRLRL